MYVRRAIENAYPIGKRCRQPLNDTLGKYTDFEECCSAKNSGQRWLAAGGASSLVNGRC